MSRTVSRLRQVLRPAHWAVASSLPPRLQRHYLHLAGTGRWGDFSRPATFTEKVNWRILHDRRPIIAQACDKLAMKDAARQRVPDEAVLRIPCTIWSGTDLDAAPLDTDRPWVLKPNHSSGEVLSSDEADAATLTRCREWLMSKPAQQLGEWGYRAARPLLLMEERIPFAGGFPNDYKFFVFDGVPRLVQVNVGRFTNGSGLAFYDPDGRELPMRDTRFDRVVDALPANWSTMTSLAATLGAGWDFIRVDLYSVGDDIWFGEYSPYPGGGVTHYRPSSFDRRLGDWWQLPDGVA